MSSTATGRKAETAAVRFLQYKGCSVLDRNWRTRTCEIDIVAERAGIVYFCEVKYRRTPAQGGGLEYITPAKLHQMQASAREWMAAHHRHVAYRLSAVEVSGPDFRITAAIADIG